MPEPFETGDDQHGRKMVGNLRNGHWYWVNGEGPQKVKSYRHVPARHLNIACVISEHVSIEMECLDGYIHWRDQRDIMEEMTPECWFHYREQCETRGIRPSHGWPTEATEETHQNSLSKSCASED